MWILCKNYNIYIKQMTFCPKWNLCWAGLIGCHCFQNPGNCAWGQKRKIKARNRRGECAYFFPPLWQGHQQPSGETATFKVKLFFSYDGQFFCKNRKHVTALNEQRKRPRLFKTRTNDFIFEGHGLFSCDENPSTIKNSQANQLLNKFLPDLHVCHN